MFILFSSWIAATQWIYELSKQQVFNDLVFGVLLVQLG